MTVGLLDAPCGGHIREAGVGGELSAGSITSCVFAGGLLGTSALELGIALVVHLYFGKYWCLWQSNARLYSDI